MSKARLVLKAILKAGWVEVSCEGSHHQLRKGDKKRTFAFHDREDLGPKAMAKVAKTFGMSPDELRSLI